MSCAWTKDRWTGKKVAEYVTENVEVEEYGPQYYSQRGEDCPPRLDSNLIEYLNDMEEYAYVYTKDQEWVCFKNQYDDAPVKANPRSTCMLRSRHDKLRTSDADPRPQPLCALSTD